MLGTLATCGVEDDADTPPPLISGFQYLATDGESWSSWIGSTSTVTMAGDVTIDGSRIVLSAVRGSSSEFTTFEPSPTGGPGSVGSAGGASGTHLLFTSEDGGRSWDRRGIEVADPLIQVPAWPFGVEWWGDGLLLLVAVSENGDPYSRIGRLRAGEDAWEMDRTYLGESWEWSQVGAQLGMAEDRLMDRAANRQIWWATLSTETGELRQGYGPNVLRGEGCGAGDFQLVEPNHFVGRCARTRPGMGFDPADIPGSHPEFYEMCYAHLYTQGAVERLDGLYEVAAPELWGCRDMVGLPEFQTETALGSYTGPAYFRVVGTLAWQLFEADGSVWAYASEAASGLQLMEPVEIAPGSVFMSQMPAWHERYQNDMFVVNTGTAYRMFVLSARVEPPLEVPIPATPCRVTEDCLSEAQTNAGFSAMFPQIAARTGDGRVLLAFDLRPPGKQYLAVGFVEDPAYPSFGLPDEPTSARLGPGGALERACARLGACFPDDPGVEMAWCLERWSRRAGATDELDRAYQGFIAAAESGSCSAFDGVEPATITSGEPCPGPCVGEIAVQCGIAFAGAPLTVEHVRNCAEIGSTCMAGADGQGYCGSPDTRCQYGEPGWCEGDTVVECGSLFGTGDCGALGLVCSAGECVEPVPCDGTVMCDGTVAVRAATCSEDRQGRTRPRECARLGLPCRHDRGGCGPDDAPGCDPSEPPTCEGVSLRYCAYGAPREVDCTSVGASGCSDGGTGARCTL